VKLTYSQHASFGGYATVEVPNTGEAESEGSTGCESAAHSSCFRLVSSMDDGAFGESGNTLIDSALNGGDRFTDVDNCSTAGTDCWSRAWVEDGSIQIAGDCDSGGDS
jgi:hypothetical protein